MTAAAPTFRTAEEFVDYCEACLRAEKSHPPALIEAERRMYDALTHAYRRGAQATVLSIMEIVSGLPKTVSEAQLDELLDRTAEATSVHLGPLVEATAQPAINRAAHLAYQYGRQSVVVDDSPRRWNTSDQHAMGWLGNDALYWVGKANDRTLIDKDGKRKPLGSIVASEVQAGIFKGESSEAIGRRLKGLLEGTVGEQHDAYWRGLAANAATRAATFGACEAFVQADVTHYEVVAVLDERTSTICRELDGKVFEVRHLVQQRDALMAASDPEEVKSISPWLSASDAVDLHAAGGTEALAAAGVVGPPFHFHCRTTIVVAATGFEATTSAPTPPLPSARSDEERQRVFLESFNPEDHNLYATGWDNHTSTPAHLGQVINPDGYATGTPYRQPWMVGLKLSAWPTYPPPAGRAWWRPSPGVHGGEWVVSKAPDGAIRSNSFLKWIADRRAEQQRPGVPLVQ